MKLSIITINFNNAIGLQKTINSIADQTYCEYEHVIIDGDSADESVAIIQKYDYEQRSNAMRTATPVIRWTSQPDKGIYNAMNKGVRMAQGEYVLMLNSGDYFVDNHVLEKILPLLDGTDIVQGNIVEEHDGKICANQGYGSSEITIIDIMRGNFLHQASFCRRDLFERYGYFDESYSIEADKKFFMICLGIHNASFKYVNVNVANFDRTGISSVTSGPWYQKHEEERKRVLHELFSPRIVTYIEESEKKVRKYDNLCHNRLSRGIVNCLEKII